MNSATISSALALLAAAIVVAAPSAAADSRAPRIVSAAMQDADGDARADRLRVTYSERVRHAADRDGRFPFRIAGYKIRSVGSASAKTIVIALVERSAADGAARPAVSYRRTTSKAVKDRAGNQARAQVFRAVRAHGRGPQQEQPPAPPAPPLADSDGDGVPDTQDCGPNDAAIRPGVADVPDLAFVDSNCDGIDGDEQKAIFASPLGDDANPGTKAAPKRQIQAAVSAADAAGKHVYAAAGEYARVVLISRVEIYGGYGPENWNRIAGLTTSIAGSPEGVYGDKAANVVLQHLTVRGSTLPGAGASAYGIRLVHESNVRLERVAVIAGDGALGAFGATGETGFPGQEGGFGSAGSCDSSAGGGGGSPGRSAVSEGARGGRGGYDGAGENGFGVLGGGGGGLGGASGNPGKDGNDGRPGSTGGPGTNGSGGSSTTQGAGELWAGATGADGAQGGHGTGGGGGGGGGGQTGIFVNNGRGGGGGGGGGGGEGGDGGLRGGAGGGSFGVYLHNSTLTLRASSSIVSGNGGAGGKGGDGGPGGSPGPGGWGIPFCFEEVGTGGSGGPGGRGGRGGGAGGGAGGPSVAIFRAGTSTLDGEGYAASTAAPGPGGAGGAGGSGAGAPGATGIRAVLHP